ncbi:MAG: response regulator [Candidatus Pacebacteria bacterium]|nr:response regulator [Candidatus Paceibacterota bacterium]
MTTPKNKYSVYIVDDDVFLLDMYNLKFQHAEHDVHCFSDPAQALEEIRKSDTHIDAVLLDLIMPKMTGFELLKAIREENLCDAQTAIVVLSNQGQDRDIEEARSYGIDGYLIKANTLPSEVLERVTETIAEKHKK